jgi:hypothetical protein
MLALLRLLLLLLAAAAATAGCDGILDPSQLDHPRILAARATPASLGPGEVARLELLISRGDGTVAVVVPTEAQLPAPALATGLTAVPCDDDGAVCVRAPDADALAQARRAAGLADDAELVVDVLLPVEIDGELRTASKQLRLGVTRPPLPALEVTLDGQVVSDDDARPTGVAPVTLEVTAPGRAADAPPLEVDWAASAGELDDADDARATWQAPTEPAEADVTLVVVVRDPLGDVAWRILTLRPATTGR